MEYDKFDFDPVKDIQPVDQYGFVDLKSALANSVVPSQMPGSDEDYNGIDDPDSIIGKPHDIFEAIDLQKALEKSAATDNIKSDVESKSE